MLGSGVNLVTTIIGFGMSATFVVFVCTRLICGRLRRMDSRHIFELDPGMDFELPEYQSNGLEPMVVAAIPMMKFNHDTFSTMKDAECVICLGEYQEKEVLRIMPKCGHIFHLSCIDAWLRRQSTCPVCRLPVQDALEIECAQAATLGNEAQSFDSSGISVEHSQFWVLPSVGVSDGMRSNQVPADSFAINVGVSGLVPSRS